ncbi:MAG TPA: lysophospholipid acyltransferase family protein [Rhizomicrobium sp.]|jgi:1-acyl-sn-glycerol-3-phosphate acyltransferase|nr:lysophospholipid acyltransferase family protein [Rhizomicrobium sp.]
MMQGLRSALFLAWFLAVTTILSLIFLPVLAGPRQATVWLARLWARLTFWGLKAFAGIGFEVRGMPPAGPVLVASKHMSMWDTLALYLTLHEPAIVLKRELLRIPFYGWFLAKAAAIPIDRGAGARALRKMSDAARQVLAQGRPILIFPEGTRKRPGAAPDYKPGVAGLYGLLGVACVPVALNSGVYWTGFLKRPGTIVLEFLEPIPPGLKRDAFMTQLQSRIESATSALLP